MKRKTGIALLFCAVFFFTGCAPVSSTTNPVEQTTKPVEKTEPVVPAMPKDIVAPKLEEPILLRGEFEIYSYKGKLMNYMGSDQYMGMPMIGGIPFSIELLSPFLLEDATVTMDCKAKLSVGINPRRNSKGEIETVVFDSYPVFQMANGMDWELLRYFYENDEKKYEQYNEQLREAWKKSEKQTLYKYNIFFNAIEGLWRESFSETETITDCVLHAGGKDYPLDAEVHLVADAMPYYDVENKDIWFGNFPAGKTEDYHADGVALSNAFRIEPQKNVTLKRLFFAESDTTFSDISFWVEDGVRQYSMKWDGVTPLELNAGAIYNFSGKWHAKPGYYMLTLCAEYEIDGKTKVYGDVINRIVSLLEPMWIAYALGWDVEGYYEAFHR